MPTLSTGNPIVDAVTKINFTGDITPRIWRKTITKENGKPYALARDLLSDFVYFYRAKETTDPLTGVVTLEKKFKYDMLYRTYAQLIEEYGESQQTIRRALNRLEQIGVIKKHLRTIEENGFKYNNVLFIEVVPEILLELTYPTNENVTNHEENVNKESEKKEEEAQDKEQENPESFSNQNEKEMAVEPYTISDNLAEVTENGDLIPPPSKNGRRVLSDLEGHTENTTKNNKDMFYINHSIKTEKNIIKQKGVMDGMDEGEPVEVEDYVASCLNISSLMEQHSEDRVMVLEMYATICDMISVPRKSVTIKGTVYPWEIVQKQFFKLTDIHVSSILKRIRGQPIKNMHAYLISALYTESLVGNIQSTVEQTEKVKENIDYSFTRQKNQFHNFPQRNYSKNEIDELEKRLLARGYLQKAGKEGRCKE